MKTHETLVHEAEYGEPEVALRALRTLKARKNRMTVNDLLVLAAAGQAVLKTNRALKGDRRRMLRNAVNRAMKFVETL